MATVLVLGAGATLANAEAFHRRRLVAQNPPLDFTFFEKIRSLGITVPSELRTYAADLPGTNPFAPLLGRPEVRMEELFKDLFNDFQQAGPRTKVVSAYEQLIDIYVRVLRETTNWIGDDNRVGGPVGRLIAEAAGRPGPVTIVTFNHDLVIENEISKRARLRMRWCLDDGYGNFGQEVEFTRPEGLPLLRRHDDDDACDHRDRVWVLKLHGSLNWYVRIAGRHPSARVLLGGGRPRVFVSARRFIQGQLRYAVRRPGRGRSNWYTWPVIVPPVYVKDALIRTYVNSVWEDARTALSQADRIIFFGYSMPVLDVQAERMFQRTLADNADLEFVDIINPSGQTLGRYASLFSFKPIRWYPTIEDFLDASWS